MLSRELHLARVSDKYQSLLWAAVVAFSSHGTRGMSLRDIAAAAGTSLTLINHHFGSKSELVNATITSLFSVLREPESRLRFELETIRDLDARALVDIWLDYAGKAFAHERGSTYLRLMMRLQADHDLDASTRTGLDMSQRPVRRALRRVYPGASARHLDLAWAAASSAIHQCLLASDAEEGGADWLFQRPVLREFLIAGIESAALARASLKTSDELRPGR